MHPALKDMNPVRNTELSNMKNKISNGVKNILFFGIGDVGDAVMKTAVFKALRQHLPEASIHVLLGSWNAELLKGNPYVDKIYCYDYPWGNLYYGLDKNWLHKIYFLFSSSLLGELRKQPFDAAICFSLLKMDRLLMFFLRAKEKIGYTELWNDCFLTHPVSVNGSIITVIESSLLLLDPIGIHAEYCLPELQLNEQDMNELKVFLGNKFDEQHNIIVICPGAGGPANKRWLPEYFSEIADRLAEERGNTVVLSGSSREKALIDEVKKYLRNKVIINYEKLSLRGFAALIARSNIVICNNAAPMHLAAAFGRPAVVLNGGFNDQIEALKWGYKVNNIVILTADVGRRPADYRHPVCERHICMREIKPDFVLEEARKLLCSSDKAVLIERVNSKIISTTMRCEAREKINPLQYGN